MLVQVVPIRFGFERPQPVLPRHKEFYVRISRACFDADADPEIRLDCDRTMPIAAERSVSAETVARTIGTGLDKLDGRNVLIDLGGPDEKDVSRPDVVLGLTAAIDRLLSKRADIVVVVLLPFSLAEHDIASPTLIRLAEDGRVRVLSCEGDTYGVHLRKLGDGLTSDDVAAWVADAKADPLANLRTRLIRRVGQYKLPHTDAIVRHLYDGSRAFNEIYELAGTAIRDHLDAKGSRKIAYDVRHSSWFRGPVEAALRDAGIDDMLPIDGPPAADALKDAGLLMVPIVRTGTSLARLMAGYDREERPKVWALLSTQGKKEQRGTRMVKLDPAGRTVGSQQISYALRVDAGDGAVDLEFWRSSGLDPISPDQETAGILASDVMWGMIFEAGLAPEDPVPPHRGSIGYVPRFGAIASRNGPFIATKFDALLKDVFSSALPPSIGFLCPDEPNAVDLANSLRNLAGRDTILVGRGLIDAYASAKAARKDAVAPELEKVRKPLEAWRRLTQQASPAERPQIVLLDEFDLSGRTFEGMLALADEFELPVLCTVSLASYEGAAERKDLQVPRLTLYRMGRAHQLA